MRNLLRILSIPMLLAFPGMGWQEPQVLNSARITIQDTGAFRPFEPTAYDAGPVDSESAVNVANILNYHYYPGLNLYLSGNNAAAKREMDYFLERPDFTRNNPRQKGFLSVAHYVRGMIYRYHASGLGRLGLARGDFEESIKSDPKNYYSYIELSKVFLELGLKNKAEAVLDTLIALNPPIPILHEAQNVRGAK